MRTSILIILLTTTILIGAVHPSVTLAQDTAQIPALILLTEDNPLYWAETRVLVNAAGGRVAHLFPHRALIARLPPDVIPRMATTPAIAEVFTEPLDIATRADYDAELDYLWDIWNNLISPPDTAEPRPHTPREPKIFPTYADSFIAPDLPSGPMRLTANAPASVPGYYQTSEYMIGAVAVGIILLESDGSAEPSTEDWTAAEQQLVFREIVAAADWWAAREPRANLSFVYDEHISAPLPTGVEPINHAHDEQELWITDAMTALGYDSSQYYFQSVRDYNNALRARYQTDWAFTVFVVDSSADADNEFSDGYSAYSYRGGPFMVLTYGNNGYGLENMDAVTAHEMGHIFHALDQYAAAAAPCTERSGYLDVENQNSEYGTCALNAPSIMRGQLAPYHNGAVDEYARGQIGWRDSDDDDILDPVDVTLAVSVTSVSQEGYAVTINGAAEIMPYHSPTHADVTINTIIAVQYRLNGGAWQQASASDGAFDGTSEGYCGTTTLSPGEYTLEISAHDTAGNVSQHYTTRITILDEETGAESPGQIAGEVRLESRPAGPHDAVRVTLGNLPPLTTTAAGSFTFENVPAGIYRLSFEHPLYLDVAYPFVVTGGLINTAVLTLTAGDVNADQQIDVTDLALVAEEAVPGADLKYDLNGDGTTDSTDVEIVGRNLDRALEYPSLQPPYTPYPAPVALAAYPAPPTGKDFTVRGSDLEQMITVSISGTAPLAAFDVQFDYDAEMLTTLDLALQGDFGAAGRGHTALQQMAGGRWRVIAAVLGEAIYVAGEYPLFTARVRFNHVGETVLHLREATLVGAHGEKLTDTAVQLLVNVDYVPRRTTTLFLPLILRDAN